jgi:pyruvate,water dikinase
MKGSNLKKAKTFLNNMVPEFVEISYLEDTIPFKSNFYAVRSSSVNEDSNTSSAAGMYKTILYVKEENLKEKIAEVLDNAGKCIVQKMINSDWSGVIFTKGSEIKMYIVSGLCDGVTSGRLMTDEYIYINDKFELLKQNFEYNLDIEFTFEKGLLYCLQCRKLF